MVSGGHRIDGARRYLYTSASSADSNGRRACGDESVGGPGEDCAACPGVSGAGAARAVSEEA